MKKETYEKAKALEQKMSKVEQDIKTIEEFMSSLESYPEHFKLLVDTPRYTYNVQLPITKEQTHELLVDLKDTLAMEFDELAKEFDELTEVEEEPGPAPEHYSASPLLTYEQVEMAFNEVYGEKVSFLRIQSWVTAELELRLVPGQIGEFKVELLLPNEESIVEALKLLGYKKYSDLIDTLITEDD